jgi:glycerol-3-phosphate dehydrogenase subunit C
MLDVDLKLDNCVKCADCNAACPVSKVYPDFPGPKALGPDMERFRREGVKSDTTWVDYCLGCHHCDLVCPHGVNVSELIANGKAQHKKSGMRSVRDHWLARPNTLGKLCSSTAPLSNTILNLKPNRWLMSSLAEITSQRRFPAYSAEPLRSTAKNKDGDSEVLFFPGCFVRYNNPQLGQTVIELLRLNGFAVEVAPDICCGMPAIANGDGGQLMSCMEDNIAALVKTVEKGAAIVTACTSCGYTLKADYPHLSARIPALAGAAHKVSSNTYDLAELLTARLNAGSLHTDFEPMHRRLAYHAPCHLKSQGIGRPWLRLLRAVPGIEVEEIKADCCGMAGTYGFKNEKYQISMDIGRELFDGIEAYRPDAVVTECGSCQMQIAHGTGLKTVHPAEILRAACHAAGQPVKAG